MTQTEAVFLRKQSFLEPKPFRIEKVVSLSDPEYRYFQKHLLENYDFIQQIRNELYEDADLVHCLLVVGETSQDGILVNSEGAGYARYTAHFPNARQLLEQGQINLQGATENEETWLEEPAMTMGGMA